MAPIFGRLQQAAAEFYSSLKRKGWGSSGKGNQKMFHRGSLWAGLSKGKMMVGYCQAEQKEVREGRAEESQQKERLAGRMAHERWQMNTEQATLADDKTMKRRMDPAWKGRGVFPKKSQDEEKTEAGGMGKWGRVDERERLFCCMNSFPSNKTY